MNTATKNGYFTFKDLLVLYPDVIILERLFELYPDQKKSREGYEKVIRRLRRLKPVAPRNLMLRLAEFEDKFEGKKYVHVDGYVRGSKWGLGYAIEFMSWREWLGMLITKKTIKDFSSLDIVAHSLWELTWSGFSEKEIRQEVAEMSKVAEEVRNA